MIRDMQLRNFSPGTQRGYLRAVAGLAQYYYRSPDTIGPEEIQDYVVYLLRVRGLESLPQHPQQIYQRPPPIFESPPTAAETMEGNYETHDQKKKHYTLEKSSCDHVFCNEGLRIKRRSMLTKQGNKIGQTTPQQEWKATKEY